MDLSPDLARRDTLGSAGKTAARSPSRAVIALSLLVALLALVAAAAGLFGQAGAPTTFTNLFGQEVTLYGRGLYRHDSLMTGAGFLGQDAVVLFLGIPLLLFAAHLYRRGSLRGALLLTGVLGYFLYVYVSMAFGAAYNNLFLVYVALSSASLFGFVLAFASIDLEALANRVAAGMPSRGPALFMFAGGAATLLIWGGPLLEAMLDGVAPDLVQSYSTAVTYAFDLAVITPGCFVAGYLLLRRDPLGIVIAFPLLLLIVLLLPTIILMTVSQLAAGVVFTTAEIVGPISGFAVLGLLGIWVLATLLRHTVER